MLWSDHGDFAGQYGLVEKWDTTFADCLTHVPCVLAGGGLPEGRTVTAPSDHTDLAPTFLALLGMEPTWGVQGHDLTPVITGACPAVRDAIFADGGHEAEMRRRFNFTGGDSGKQRTYRQCPDSMARAKMVRTGRHKLIMRQTGDHELYDLDSDRWELNNRWSDSSLAGVRQELMERLIQWTLATDTDRPVRGGSWGVISRHCLTVPAARAGFSPPGASTFGWGFSLVPSPCNQGEGNAARVRVQRRLGGDKWWSRRKKNPHPNSLAFGSEPQG